MSKYKAEDMVLLEGQVYEVEDGNNPIYRVVFKNGDYIMFREKDLIDASKTYEDGLNDAWELARKICGQLENENNYTIQELKKIFGHSYCGIVMNEHTYQQALAKIEAYEESKAIKVGDVVRRISGNEEYLIITEEEDDSVYEYGVIDLKSMTIDRITGDLSKFEKTGRHIDISSILEQIRGNE